MMLSEDDVSKGHIYPILKYTITKCSVISVKNEYFLRFDGEKQLFNYSSISIEQIIAND